VIKLCAKFYRNRTVSIRSEVIDNLANFRSRYVTLLPWPLTPWLWTFVVHWVPRNQTLYQTSEIEQSPAELFVI